MLTQMMNYINQSNLLNKYQFGFQNKQLSNNSMLFFTETILNMENGINTALNCLGLAKAFNSFSHKSFV